MTLDNKKWSSANWAPPPLAVNNDNFRHFPAFSDILNIFCQISDIYRRDIDNFQHNIDNFRRDIDNFWRDTEILQPRSWLWHFKTIYKI